MDLIKTGLGMRKHKQSQILNPTNILMTQITDHFMNDFIQETEKRVKMNEHLEKVKQENDQQTLTDMLSEESGTKPAEKAKLESKMNQLLLELVDTERTYVEDLEEVCSSYLCLGQDLTKRHSLTQSSKHSLTQSSKPRLATCGARRPHSYPAINQSYNQDTGESAPDVDKKQIRDMLGNIEDIKDHHKNRILPALEKGRSDSSIMRALFESEEQKLNIKYGRYCINSRRSTAIIEENLQFFSLYQTNRGLRLRIDAQLIKPVQRITRYHMFLNDLCKASNGLGDVASADNYSAALKSVLSVVSHTNTMMWVGNMTACPLSLCGQGQLIKHGKVLSKKIHEHFMDKKRWPCCLLLFQQTAILCKIVDHTEKLENPSLEYFKHINVNHIEAVLAEDSKTFVIYKMKQIDVGVRERETCDREIVMKIECGNEDAREDWLKTIKNEIEKLQTMAFSLSYSL